MISIAKMERSTKTFLCNATNVDINLSMYNKALKFRDHDPLTIFNPTY